MKRKHLLALIVILVGLAFLSRLYYLQVIDQSYKFMADSNSRREKIIYASRGYIYDRNGELIVANQAAYNLMVTYAELKEFDTLGLAELVKIDKQEITRGLKKFKEIVRSRKYSIYQPYPLVTQISKEDFPALQEKIFKYQGFSIEKTSMRDYIIKTGANVLGYLSEISETQNNKDYKLGDILGATGVEKVYEKQLRGTPGIIYEQINVSGKASGSYKNGEYDVQAVAGKDLFLGLDAQLQAYGERLMKGKRGSIVAIEPSTGEILALITAPSYDPSLLSGRMRSKNYNVLIKDLAQPMYDRGLLAEYAPGSPWKIVTGLVALQTGATNSNFTTTCTGGFRVGKHRMNCLCRTSYPLNLQKAYQHSCNTHFATLYKNTLEKAENSEKGLKSWTEIANSLGFGKYLGTDLSTGRKGNIPTSEFYDKIYGNRRWGASTTISNAIGQGEIVATPIQLANLAAIIANEGSYYRPHIIKLIQDENIDHSYKEKIISKVDQRHFRIIKEGMADVFRYGTARWVNISDFQMSGKTGTVENFRRINNQKVQLPDHGTFIAFAPTDNPKIAISVVVENSVWGARAAAPIASLMMEKYILRETKRPWLEQSIENMSFEETYKKYEIENNYQINQD